MQRATKSPLYPFAFVFALLAILACGGVGEVLDEVESELSSETNGESVSATSTPIELDSGPRTQPGTLELVAADAGGACFGTTEGISCLDQAGEWATYTDDSSDLEGDSIYATALCPDGSYLFAHVSGISQFDGTSWTTVSDDWDGGSADGIACDENGGIWVAHYEGVSYFNGSWTTFPSTDLSSGEDQTDLVESVIVAQNGDVWVGTASSVARYDGSSWQIFQEGQGFDDRLFVATLAEAPDGAIWVAHSQGLAVYRDDAWSFIDAPDYGLSFTSLAVDELDQAWLGTLSDGIKIYVDGGWGTHDTDQGLPAVHVKDVVRDAQGRIWAATSYGLSVYDGDAWNTYHMHTAPLVDNTIEHIVIAAGGPVLPAPASLATGSLAGQLFGVDGTTPITDAAVEVCPERVSSFRFNGGAPCEDQPLILTATTDSNGRFVLDNIPTGLYSITIETGKGEWAHLTGLFGFAERVLIPSGEALDLGELFLEPDE